MTNGYYLVMLFDGYAVNGVWDELFVKPGVPRTEFRGFYDHFASQSLSDFADRHRRAEESLIRAGITFAVQGDKRGREKIFPFDLLPRLVSGSEWNVIETGLTQRIRALNLFIDDIYHEQKILRQGVVPADLILSSPSYRRECLGLDPPRGIWIHVTGTDLVRDKKGTFLVLEDNLRCPSGISYVLENRELLKRAYPHLFDRLRIRQVEDYTDRLFDVLEYITPESAQRPKIGVLTPGPYNSAYFEHSYLARKMGVELVEGRDLVVAGGAVCLRTTRGLTRVDVLYRRIDDDFLDPSVFRSDSLVGVKGLMGAMRRGTVALANAPGTGVADDKAVYAFVPDIIRYYLGEEMILPNVTTYLCHKPSDCSYVLENLNSLVVKATNESGGYGMLMGHQATKEELSRYAEKIRANPRNYIAQPVIELSQAPTLIGESFEGRRVDLRPYVLYGKDVSVIAGGLTRVALNKDSLVVNSSQGGGSKDTWVLHETRT